jgi:hypothetical protein
VLPGSRTCTCALCEPAPAAPASGEGAQALQGGCAQAGALASKLAACQVTCLQNVRISGYLCAERGDVDVTLFEVVLPSFWEESIMQQVIYTHARNIV